MTFTMWYSNDTFHYMFKAEFVALVKQTYRWDGCRKGWGLGEDVKFLPPSSMSAALSDPSVHASVITTPTFSHEEIVVASLEAGKHVFCEKPLAPTVEGVRNCYRMAEEADRVLFCAFNRRFDPAHQVRLLQ